MTDPSGVESAVEAIVAETGGIFGLVNNAGIGLRGCFEDLTEAEIRQVFEANVFGTMAVTRQVLPHMRAAGRGRVVTITSVGARIATFGLGAYCSTKFAQEGFAESLALELAPFGLHSILIEPGMIKTSRWTVNRGTAANAFDSSSPYRELFRRHEELSDRFVESRKTRPVDVAKAVHRALSSRRPRMRYVVGRPASVAVAMRRLLPGRAVRAHLLRDAAPAHPGRQGHPVGPAADRRARRRGRVTPPPRTKAGARTPARRREQRFPSFLERVESE